ncbi:MAG: hypothetical protein ACXWFS_08405 [Thermoanaerobaculia bacterium]
MSAISASAALFSPLSAGLKVCICDSRKLTRSPGATLRWRGVTPYTSPMNEPSAWRRIDLTSTPPSAV